MSEKGERRQRPADWFSLAQLSLLIFVIGMITGVFASNCPAMSADAPTWAKIVILVAFTYICLLGVVMFVFIGQGLMKGRNDA